MEDQHPADSLLETLKSAFNGDGIKQTLREAWDRLHASAPSAHDQAIQQMNDQANAQRTQDATKSFITPDAAANIRKKMSK